MQWQFKPMGVLVFMWLMSLYCAATAAEPVRIVLWEGGAPGTPATQPENEPVLFLYRPATDVAMKTAVVVCPGGGYRHLAMDHEGRQIAEWFNKLGVTACVLQYRNNSSGHQHPVPMLDGQRAIRTVRSRAAEWGVDPQRIGVMGFSAGGHLASTLATHFDDGRSDASDAVERAGSRPDFLILCYPVISMTQAYMHRGSRENLLGLEPDEALARSLSNETQVTAQTPPTFIFQTDADTAVPAENCVAFYLALRRAGVPAEMHIYQDGKHGVGLARDVPATSTWPDRLRDWLRVRGLVAGK
jgi:acetyl esterase/lipase